MKPLLPISTRIHEGKRPRGALSRPRALLSNRFAVNSWLRGTSLIPKRKGSWPAADYALRPPITDPRQVRLSLGPAPRLRRHETALSIADHQGHHRPAAAETHPASQTSGDTPARPRDFSSLSASPNQGGYRHRTRGSEKTGGRWSVVGGRWSVVGGRWSVVGAWCLVLGAWCLVLGGS